MFKGPPETEEFQEKGLCKYRGLIIRIGFWGISYHNYNDKESPKNSIGNYL